MAMKMDTVFPLLFQIKSLSMFNVAYSIELHNKLHQLLAMEAVTMRDIVDLRKAIHIYLFLNTVYCSMQVHIIKTWCQCTLLYAGQFTKLCY